MHLFFADKNNTDPGHSTPTTDCKTCPNVVPGSSCEVCSTGNLWDGDKCISKETCPCVVDSFRYKVGSTYLSHCRNCTCREGGDPDCNEFKCPRCTNPSERGVPIKDCKCVCKPCEQGYRICPTNNKCIRMEQWCDGVTDCEDDEIGCPTPGASYIVTVEQVARSTDLSQCYFLFRFYLISA
jgi:von Willebrand factor